MRFKLLRHRALAPSYGIDPTLPFLGFTAMRQIILERPAAQGRRGGALPELRPGDARHAQRVGDGPVADGKRLASQPEPDQQPLGRCLSGHDHVSVRHVLLPEDQPIRRVQPAACTRSTPSRPLRWACPRSARIGTAAGNLASGAVDPVLPNVDMFFYDVAAVGNGTLRPDSGRTYEHGNQNCNLMAITDASAEEHQVLNRYYQQTNARLHGADAATGPGTQGSGIVALNVNNYAAQGQTVYQGKALQAHDPALWQQVVSAFQNVADGAYVTAYITPGPMTNSAYKGMAALVLGWGQWLALITPGGLNGGFAVNLPDGTIAPPATVNWNLSSCRRSFLKPAAQCRARGGAGAGASGPLASARPPTIRFRTTSLIPVSAAWAANAGSLLGLAPQGNLNQSYRPELPGRASSRGFLGWLTDAGPGPEQTGRPGPHA